MKKSTILILIIVYLGSIFIVGVYGLRVRYGNETIYCDKITPTKIELSTGTIYDGEKIKTDQNTDASTTYNISISSKDYVEGLTVVVSYALEPAECTHNDVKIVIVSTSDDPPATIVDGKIVFTRKAAVTVKFYATDRGAGAAEMTINIRFGR